MAVEEIKGFSVVPVVLTANNHWKPVSEKKSIKHYMYAKKHQTNSKDSIEKELVERSLFLINPPLNAKFQEFKNFFKDISSQSILENVLINDEKLDYEINLTKLTSELYNDEQDKSTELKLPNGTALIVFVDKTAASSAFSNLKKYIKRSEKELYVWNENRDEFAASKRFINQYKNQVLNLEKLSAEVELSLADFEKRENELINDLKTQKDIVDEDGFTLVVGKNRKTKRGILGKIDSATTHFTEEIKKRNDRLQKKDFYRFQIRERKKNEMNELLKKFRNDQERIKELKEKKRFRPY